MGKTQENVPQPAVVAAEAAILQRDGLQFKDLNGNGRLDPYDSENALYEFGFGLSHDDV